MNIRKEDPLLFELLRRPCRRGLRMALRATSSPSLKALAYRVPFSRFHRLARWCLWGTEVIEWRGVKIEVNPGHLLDYYAYFFGDYATQEIDTLVELCRDARVFIDVGANSGLFSLAVARACPMLSVVALEPDRQVAARFRKNLERNVTLSQRIRLEEKAAGAIDGMWRFVPSSRPENPGLGRLATDSACKGGYDVPVVRLDSFFGASPKPDVVKIDVEGGEVQVLQGMTGLFALDSPKAILVETHGFSRPGRSKEFNAAVAAELGKGAFTLSYLRGGNWLPLTDPAELGPHAQLLALKN